MKYLLFLFPILLMFSCNKNSEITPHVETCELKTINFDTAQNGYFDIKTSGNHIVQLTMATDTQTKQVYEFNSLDQFIKREDFTNADNLGADLVRSRSENFYDQSGTLIKTFQYNQSYSGGVALGLYFAGIDSFFYSSGHIAELRSYAPFNGTYIYQGVTKFTWANDDLITLKQYGQNGQLYHSVDFSYDLTKENKFDSLFNDFYIQGFFEAGHHMEGIRRSKHILTSAIEEWTGAPAVPINFITTFHENGLVKSIQEVSYGDTFYIFRFGYSCN